MAAVINSKKINLALQGGGAHGAYTWGALDRLLEEDRLIIEGISGTSAGAMNAAMLVNGYMQGGNEGAKAALADFWRRISDAAFYSPLHKNPIERMLTGWNMDLSPSYHFFDLLSRVFSPYELNPLDYNPMRQILEDVLDTEALSACSKIKLYISATHVGSGQARVFHCDEITVDVLMASTCIPFLFKAVVIDGEEYWDGGYMGNPAIWPLIYNCDSEDVVLIQINPLHKDIMPRTASEIINRLNEITFNSSLTAEMRAISFVSKLIREGKISGKEYKDMRMHLIYSPEEMKSLNASSKMNADWDFFQHLRNIGYNAADGWLKDNWASIGKKSTLDIHDKFLCGAGVKSPGESESDKNTHSIEMLNKKSKPDKNK
jgi:NTE family protein